MSNIELKNLTGCNPSLMTACVLASDEHDAKTKIVKAVRSFVEDSILPSVKDNNFLWVNLLTCRKYFYYASNECEIPIGDLDDYYQSSMG